MKQDWTPEKKWYLEILVLGKDQHLQELHEFGNTNEMTLNQVHDPFNLYIDWNLANWK